MGVDEYTGVPSPIGAAVKYKSNTKANIQSVPTSGRNVTRGNESGKPVHWLLFSGEQESGMALSPIGRANQVYPRPWGMMHVRLTATV